MRRKKKTQGDAVVEAIENNGGYSKLINLYKKALEIPEVEWNTLTPDASIRRIVQTDNRIVSGKATLF